MAENRGKECHLAFRIATVGAMHIGLDEFADCESFRGFFRCKR
jgi:hypothetical protein